MRFDRHKGREVISYSREVVPTTVRPNFRDHRRTVERSLLKLVWRLAAKWGEAFVSVRSLREMLFEDVGHMPGVDTVRQALKRFEAQGLLGVRWLLAGQILPDGAEVTHGCLLIRPYNHRTRRTTERDKAKKPDPRVRNRLMPSGRPDALLRTLAAGLAPPPVASAQGEFERKKAAALAAAAELAAQFDAEDRTKPPD